MSLRGLLDTSPLPSDKARHALNVRRKRLAAMAVDAAKTTNNLANLIAEKQISEIQIRSEFVYQVTAADIDASDRQPPPSSERPPSTRLISPRGAALRIELLALLHAHLDTGGRAGGRPVNKLPLKRAAGGSGFGWVDLFASDAIASGSGSSFLGVNDKKQEQFKNALLVLEREELVTLPHKNLASGKYEEFVLMSEGGRRSIGQNEPYRIPKAAEETFSLPATFFSNGWINVLADIEIAFVLMLAFAQKFVASDRDVRINSRDRLLHYGVGRDSYSAALSVLRDVGLVSVTEDLDRHPNGWVKDYGNKSFVPPYGFRLLPDGFADSGYMKLGEYINYQLSRPRRPQTYRIPKGGLTFVTE